MELIAKFIFPQMLPSLFDPYFSCRVTCTLQPLLMLMEEAIPMQTSFFSPSLSLLDTVRITYLA